MCFGQQHFYIVTLQVNIACICMVHSLWIYCYFIYIRPAFLRYAQLISRFVALRTAFGHFYSLKIFEIFKYKEIICVLRNQTYINTKDYKFEGDTPIKNLHKHTSTIELKLLILQNSFYREEVKW